MRSVPIDLGRIFFAFMAVGVHIGLLSQTHPFASDILNNGIARLTVPYFLTVTGYFIGTADRGRWMGLIRRVLLLYVVWTLIYSPQILRESWNGNDPLIPLVWGYWHLWYLVALAEGGVLVLLTMRLGLRMQLGIAGLILLAGCILQLWLLRQDPNQSPPFYLYRNGLFQAFPFLILGLWARQLADRPVPIPTAWLGTGLVVSMGLLMGEWALVDALTLPGKPVDLYLSAMPAALFLLLVLARGKPRNVGQVYAQFAAAIYFGHVGVALLAWRLLPGDSPLLLPFIYLGSIALAFVLMRLNRKVPLL